MCEQLILGKVYIFITKEDGKEEWTKIIKYYYNDQRYNIYMNDNDYKNIKKYKNKSEIDMIKIANQEIDDLSILFCQSTKKILIGGNLNTYNEVCKKNSWLPPLAMLPKEKKSRKR
jgi:hypothetical protein